MKQNVFLIGFFGLVGSGKSTVAKKLAPLIKADIVCSDRIRLGLRNKRKSYEVTDDLVEQAVIASLKQGRSVVLDSDVGRADKRKRLMQLAKQLGIRLVYLRIVAEPDVMLGRMLTVRYTPSDFFGGAATSWRGPVRLRGNVVKIREMWRRTPHHYTWVPEGGGQWRLKPLNIPLLDTIDTTDGKRWQRQIQQVARKLRA